MLNAQPGIAVGAPAVSDVVHILAELIGMRPRCSVEHVSGYHRLSAD